MPQSTSPHRRFSRTLLVSILGCCSALALTLHADAQCLIGPSAMGLGIGSAPPLAGPVALLGLTGTGVWGIVIVMLTAGSALLALGSQPRPATRGSTLRSLPSRPTRSRARQRGPR
jgi:hypothetical protein